VKPKPRRLLLGLKLLEEIMHTLDIAELDEVNGGLTESEVLFVGGGILAGGAAILGGAGLLLAAPALVTAGAVYGIASGVAELAGAAAWVTGN